MNENNKFIRRLKKEAEEIKNEVISLLWNRHVYKELQEISTNNPEIIKDYAFWTYLAQTYVDSTVIGIGRLLDNDSRSNSLMNLMQQIKDNNTVFTRERYINEYMKAQKFNDKDALEYTKGVAYKEFSDNFGKIFLNKAVIDKDMKLLKRKTKKIIHERHKFRAHKDKKAKRKAVFIDLDIAIDRIEGMAIKYCYWILDQTVPDNLLPTYQGNWKVIFEVPWLGKK